jgi:hypothetical protein
MSFSDTGDEGDGDDGKPRSEKDKKEGEEKKSKQEINLGRCYVPGKECSFHLNIFEL